jgi:hypothetical protein
MAAEGLEVPLHPINSDRGAVDERRGRREATLAPLAPLWSFSGYRYSDHCYDARCFGVLALSVEIRPSADEGTRVS